ncbi:phosphoglycerate mutase [Lysobacter xanthus]
MATARLVLPDPVRFAGEALPPAVASALGRAERGGDARGIEGLFDLLPIGWPAAAVTRQAQSGDAAGATWLRADPAYVRPDINGARLLAVGETLALDAASAESLLEPLRPLFGDVGLPIEAGEPSAWFLRMAADPPPLPAFASPDDALGADLFDQMPQGAEGRRWRALMSEAQVLLHQHPLNAERQARGLAPVNSVWFWGAGRLPDRIAGRVARILSPDPTLHAFAKVAGIEAMPLDAWSPADVDTAYDLRHERRLDRLCAAWLEPVVADVARGAVGAVELHWADGRRFTLRRSQSLRFWKRPLRVLAEHEDA